MSRTPPVLALLLVLGAMAWARPAAADWICRGGAKVKDGQVLVELRIDPQKRVVSAAGSLTLGDSRAIPRANLSLWLDLKPIPNSLFARTRSLAVVVVIPADPLPTAQSVMLTVNAGGGGVSKPWGRYREVVGEAGGPPPELGASLVGLTGRIPFDEAFSGDPLDGGISGPIDIRAVGDDGSVMAQARVEFPPVRSLRRALSQAYVTSVQAARNPTRRCEALAD